MRFVDEKGRKFFLVMLAMPFWVNLIVAGYLAAFLKMRIDLDVMTAAAAGVSGLATIYVGGNVLHKAQEAKIAEAEAKPTVTEEEEEI